MEKEAGGSPYGRNPLDQTWAKPPLSCAATLHACDVHRRAPGSHDWRCAGPLAPRLLAGLCSLISVRLSPDSRKRASSATACTHHARFTLPLRLQVHGTQ